MGAGSDRVTSICSSGLHAIAEVINGQPFERVRTRRFRGVPKSRLTPAQVRSRIRRLFGSLQLCTTTADPGTPDLRVTARERERHLHGNAANVCFLFDHPEALATVDRFVAYWLERNACCYSALRAGDSGFGHWPLAWKPARFACFAAFRLVLESPVTIEALLSS